VAVLSLATAVPLTVLSGQLGDGLTAWAIGIPCACVGFLVARRQPGNPLGWLFLLCAGCLFTSNDAVDYSYYVYRLGHHVPFGPLALWLAELWIVGIILLLMVTLLFPDGRPSSRFWSWALRALCALFVITLTAYAVAAGQRRVPPAAEVAGDRRGGHHRERHPRDRHSHVGDRHHGAAEQRVHVRPGGAAGFDGCGDPEVSAV